MSELIITIPRRPNICQNIHTKYSRLPFVGKKRFSFSPIVHTQISLSDFENQEYSSRELRIKLQNCKYVLQILLQDNFCLFILVHAQLQQLSVFISHFLLKYSAFCRYFDPFIRISSQNEQHLHLASYLVYKTDGVV